MEDEFESLEPGAPYIAHLVAGALAGTAEHCAMYPIDTIKTRMQAAECLTDLPARAAAQASAQAPAAGSSALYQQARAAASTMASTAASSGVASGAEAAAISAATCNVCHGPPRSAPAPSLGAMATLRGVLAAEGVRGLYKGFGAAVAGAGPAHALHFAVYEYARERLSDSKDGTVHPVATAGAAALAASIHDAVMTPAETIKQRLQVRGELYRNVLHCATSIVRREGFGTLFRGYLTGLCMSAPFTAFHYATYESSKGVIATSAGGYLDEGGHANHLVAGALAGGAAAAVTTPFDVVKTRIQTEGLLQMDPGAAPPASAAPRQTPAPPAAAASTSSVASQPAAAGRAGPGPMTAGAQSGARRAVAEATHQGFASPDFAMSRATASASGSGRPFSSTSTAASAPSSGPSGPPCGKAVERLSMSPIRAMRQIAAREGWAALLKGIGPRVLFHMPSAAICWATYEGFKSRLLPVFGPGGGTGSGGSAAA